jgi:hypothetical protein
VVDYFYRYHPLPYDGADSNGFFGYKVLALSYGGTIQLFGKKGATYGTVAASSSGTSWARLVGTIKKDDATQGKRLILDRVVDWQKNDEVVVTSTDYLPGHSERLLITKEPTTTKAAPCTTECTTFEFVRMDEATGKPTSEGVQWLHYGQVYDLSKVPSEVGPDIKVDGKRAVDTRAAVGLLTRSIRVVSWGKTKDAPFPAPDAPPSYENYFGGHTIVRQGFLSYQIQGVEFQWLGQGGRLGHYPIHFHMARQVPKDTYVRDSSVNESMTRWAVLHATQGAELTRIVGWASIGHGFYLEEGSETDNLLQANLGVFARAAVMKGDGTAQPHNPRKVPGILVAPNYLDGQEVPSFNSDYTHPTVFWIMNGWNDFHYNVAAGAGTCGVCYWLLPGVNGGMSRDMKWDGYAGMQSYPGDPSSKFPAGTTPLKSFVGNSCSSAMTAFQSIGETAPCLGVPQPSNLLKPIKNDLAENGTGDPKIDSNNGYPTIDAGFRTPTLCHDGENCAEVVKLHKCADAPKPSDEPLSRCAVTVLDRFTTAFNFQETNFAAVWLRKYWFLLTDSAISDVQNAGLTFVTGGGYSKSDVTTGQWQLVRRSAFIGHTQPLGSNPYASPAGPFVPGGLTCDNADFGNHCVNAKEGISFQISNFSTAQRLFNIYDGPDYQEANAYLDITETVLDCTPNANGACCKSENNCGDKAWGNSDYPTSTRAIGVPLRLTSDNTKVCYLPNAGIAWKQPNGFYYPPAFHSTNLFFDNVGIRHFVILPRLNASGKTDLKAVKDNYCRWTTDMFDNFTDIDRQTELNDDDGSLTGFIDTISVNEDAYFNAPIETIQCASDRTAKTSPYDYVTTVVYPTACNSPTQKVPSWSPPKPNEIFIRSCQGFDGDLQIWGTDGAGPAYGVPIYREYLTAQEVKDGATPGARMLGQGNGQRSILTANHGLYYIDTAVSQATQGAGQSGPQGKTSLNVFQGGQEYNVFAVYTKHTTDITYRVFVKEGRDKVTVENGVKAIRVKVPGGYIIDEFAFPLDKGWTRTYDPGSGILTVRIKLSDYLTEFQESKMNQCGPLSYCKWSTDKPDTGKCVCNTNAADHLFNAGCVDSICAWASKDVDCPTKGCFGFRFTLPGDFSAAGQARPKAGPFPTDRNWNAFLFDQTNGSPTACAVKEAGISHFTGTASGVSGGKSFSNYVSLKGYFSPSIPVDLTQAQNVILNALLHETVGANARELVSFTDFPLPTRLVRTGKPDEKFDATFATVKQGTPANPRLNVRKQDGNTFYFEFYVSNIDILPGDGCGKPNADITLNSSFGIYDLAQPLEVSVMGEWDCSSKTRYVGHN